MVSLMYSSGIMLMTSGPLGMILFGLVEYFTGKMERSEAFIVAGTMTLLTAVTGVILYSLGLCLYKRLRRPKAD
jgi:hypothetical protein